MSEADQAYIQLSEQVRNIASGMDGLLESLKPVKDEITRLEEQVADAGFSRAELALKDALGRIPQVEQAFIDARHVLDLPPDAYRNTATSGVGRKTGQGP